MFKQMAVVVVFLMLVTSPARAENAAPTLSASVPTRPALTMDHAIALAIQNNLSSLLSKATTEETRGRALEAAAGLLPHITGVVSQSRIFKNNLAAEGFASFPFPGFNPVIGPYNDFDARFQLVQTLLDFNVLWVRQAAEHSRKVADAQEALAREQVAAAAALAYLDAQRTARAVGAAQSDLQLSQSLQKLAHDQHQAGVSTGVDVARAETDTAQQNLKLIRAQIDADQSMLRLLRTAGLPLNQSVSLPDVSRAVMASVPRSEESLGQAQADRPEIHIARETMRVSEDELNATRSEYAPSIQATGDYGFSGNTVNSTARTGSIGGRLTLPIFTGGQIQGEIVVARAQRDEALQRYTDIQAQVEEDIRLSLKTLEAEIQETQTADKALLLARTELKMARDRFAAGVGDNIQLLEAQTALSRSLDDQVDAFARYDTARVNLATALGHTQEFKQ